MRFDPDAVLRALAVHTVEGQRPSHDGVTEIPSSAPIPGELRVDADMSFFPIRLFTVVAVYDIHCLVMRTRLCADGGVEGPVLKVQTAEWLTMISRSWWSPGEAAP